MSSFPDSIPSDDTITIPVSRGLQMIVDKVDADIANFKWTVRPSQHTYHARRNKRKNGKQTSIWAHRVIMERIVGRELKTTDLIDHVNGDGLDNRRENLRFCTRAENGRNSAKPKNNKTGYKGVAQYGKHGRFLAQIKADRQGYYLGSFDTAEEAHAAYCEAAERLHGEFARFE